MLAPPRGAIRVLAAFPRTAAELKVRRCARNGVWANFIADAVPDNPEDEQIDAMAPAQCGNVVRAEFLQALLAAGGDEVGPGGLLVRGAIITGALDLKGARGLPPLALRRCRLEETPIFEQAELGRLELSWCALPGLCADQLSARHSLFLTRSRISGPVRLTEAKVEGQLVLARAELGEPVRAGSREPRSPVALGADAIRVANLVGLDGLKAWGSVRLTGASVGGTLSLCDASLHFGGGAAVVADRIDVKGHLRLDRSTIQGSVSLRNSTIGGGLSCAGTRLYDPPLTAQHRPNRQPADALHEAKILVADQARIGGDVWLSGSRSDDEPPAQFASRGCISFLGATVNGSMVIDGASLAALEPELKEESRRHIAFDAEGLRVESRLTWRCEPPVGYVDFRYAYVHRLHDRLSTWPGEEGQGRSYLTGLVYEELVGRFSSQSDLKNRIDWLKRQPRYTSQPYEQLARFYRNSGHLRHASDVGVAREQERLRNMTEKDLKTRFSKALGRLYGLVAGFGYRPQRALACLFFLYLLTLAPLMWAELQERISPSKASEDVDVVRVQLDRSVAETSTGQAAKLAPVEDKCDDSYPCYSTLLYSLETVIPLINLRQAEYWSVESHDWPTRTLRWWLGISSILGWVLVTLIASTMLTARR
jgi:hypothetical protein